MNRGQAAARRLRLNDDILQIAHNPEVTYHWFVAHRLLWSKDVVNRRCSRVGCPSFGQLMTFAIENGKPDGGRFRCNGPRPHRLSPRDDTIFVGNNLLHIILLNMFFCIFRSQDSSWDNSSAALSSFFGEPLHQFSSRLYSNRLLDRLQDLLVCALCYSYAGVHWTHTPACWCKSSRGVGAPNLSC